MIQNKGVHQCVSLFQIKNMDIKMFLKSKKLRQSSSSYMKEKELNRASNNLGAFDVLPLELKYHVLGHCSCKSQDQNISVGLVLNM